VRYEVLKFSLTKSQSDIIEGIQNQTMGSLYIVGGAVRDLLLGREPKDIDFTTDLEPRSTQALLQSLGFITIPDQTAWDHGIVRTIDKYSGDIIDITTLRKDDACDGRHARISFTKNLREDLARRDLSINSIAADVSPDGTVDELIDPFNGQLAIQEKFILFVGDSPSKRIQEDFLRMVRACRLTALGEGWHIPESEKLAIKDHAHEINRISKEHTRDELLKALSYPNPENFIRALHDCKLLEHIIPPLHACIGVEGGTYHAENVYKHCTASLAASVKLTDNPLLRLAALLHDVGKATTVSTGQDGRTHFYRHEVEGAAIVYKWMQEYKFSKKETEYVSRMIRGHQFRFMEDSKISTIRKWLQKAGPEWRDLITLRCADRRGNLAKKDKPMMTRYMKDLVSKAEAILSRHDALFREDLAINGDDLKELGIPSGPLFAEIFQNLLGIVITDPERNTREWQLEFVRRNYVKE